MHSLKTIAKAAAWALCLMAALPLSSHAKDYTLSSPDGRLSTTVSLSSAITYDIKLDGQTVLLPSPLSMTLSTGETWGQDPRLVSAKKGSIRQTIQSPFYRSTSIKDDCQTLTLSFQGGWSLELRAYDKGIAYRFVSSRKGSYQIQSEQVTYRFNKDHNAFIPYISGGKDGDWESQKATSFQSPYTEGALGGFNQKRLAFLPLLVDTKIARVCLTEVNLEGYAGLYLMGDEEGTLKGEHALYPKTEKAGGHHDLQILVDSRQDYVARVEGPKAFPWRLTIVSDDDRDLASSTLVYQLANPCRLDDWSWVRPGKVAWEWWNAWNIYGVDFRAGINTQTYKYYIDFAARNHIEYILMDEGWAKPSQTDLTNIIDEIDMEEIVRYANERNVGVILWAAYLAFNQDMEKICQHYAQMGVKGFKIDFMNRDDQKVIDFMYRAAQTCARHHLLVNFHGTFKPAGLNREYPNVLNFEGVNGLESLKGTGGLKLNQVRYDASLPFIRQVAGPMDYTQGAMRNATRENYASASSEAMSQGTRCHQMGLYMVLDSPMNMLCDAPTNYDREQECTDLIARIPTVWDETRILKAKVGDYIITARRKGSTWYVGGITDWTPRDVTFSLKDLGLEKAHVELFQDGVNADRKASDYKRLEWNAQGEDILVHMASGGGFAAIIN